MIKLNKIVFLFFVGTSLFAMSVQTSVQPETGRIGDPILFTVSVELGDEYHLTFPRIAGRIGSFMVLSQNTETSFTDSLYIRDFQFHITAFDTGYQVIPSLPLKITDPEKDETFTLYTDSVVVYIESVLKQALSVPEVYEPIPIPVLSLWQKVILFFLILLTGLALYYFIAFKKKKRKAVDIPVTDISPIKKLKENLNNLRSKSYHLKGYWKAFYIELTACFKEYLEKKFFIHISDLPVSELITVLRTELDSLWTEEMSEMLRFADLVKFARSQSSTEQCEKDLNAVLDWCLEAEKIEITENINQQVEKSS